MESKKSASKIFSIFVLSVLFIGLPIVSYWYLKGGIKWRKEAVSELSDFGKIKEAWVILEDGRKVNLLEKKVTVLHIFGEQPQLNENNRQMLETYSVLAEQFGTTDDFRVVSIWDGNATPEFMEFYNQKKEPREGTWLRTGGLGGWRTILENQYENYRLKTKEQEVQDYFAIADTSGTIRRFYAALDKEQVTRLIQHIAILLPEQK